MTSTSYETNGQLFYQTGIEADFLSKKSIKGNGFLTTLLIMIAIVQIRKKLLSVKCFLSS